MNPMNTMTDNDALRATAQEMLRASRAAMERLEGSPEVLESLVQAASMIIAAYREGGALFVAGNGGSAADAQHLVAELVCRLRRDRSPIRAFALTVDSSILTAMGNDYGFDHLFSRQVRGLMRPQDILLAITTSGNSPNILEALRACRTLGAKSILLSGESGGKGRAEADHALLVPSTLTANIQEGHMALYHTLCALVEQGLVAAGLCQYE